MWRLAILALIFSVGANVDKKPIFQDGFDVLPRRSMQQSSFTNPNELPSKVAVDDAFDTVADEFNGIVADEFNGPVANEFNGPVADQFNSTVAKEFNGPLADQFNSTVAKEFNGPLADQFNSTVTDEFNGTMHRIAGIPFLPPMPLPPVPPAVPPVVPPVNPLRPERDTPTTTTARPDRCHRHSRHKRSSGDEFLHDLLTTGTGKSANDFFAGCKVRLVHLANPDNDPVDRAQSPSGLRSMWELDYSGAMNLVFSRLSPATDWEAYAKKEEHQSLQNLGKWHACTQIGFYTIYIVFDRTLLPADLSRVTFKDLLRAIVYVGISGRQSNRLFRAFAHHASGLSQFLAKTLNINVDSKDAAVGAKIADVFDKDGSVLVMLIPNIRDETTAKEIEATLIAAFASTFDRFSNENKQNGGLTISPQLANRQIHQPNHYKKEEAFYMEEQVRSGKSAEWLEKQLACLREELQQIGVKRWHRVWGLFLGYLGGNISDSDADERSVDPKSPPREDLDKNVEEDELTESDTDYS